MNELQIFTNPNFGEVRTIEENGKVLFCGKDVAHALGYVITSKAINDHCKGVSKMEVPIVIWVEQQGSRHSTLTHADAREITQVYGRSKNAE